MPELPEVETIVREIGPSITGHKIAGVEVRSGSSVASLSPEDLASGLVGRKIERVRRRAKYIVIDLENGNKLVVHLAMTGRLLLRATGSPEDRFTRIVFTLDKGQEVRYADARKFGRVRLLTPAEYEKIDRRHGPEPLTADFKLEEFRQGLRRRSTRIKPLLLDQSFVAGLGNIYADEALYEARINPARPARALSDDEIARLFRAIRHVLAAGVRDRGTTFDSYVDAFGRIGGHQFRLSVYRKTGEPCPRCGTPIERQVIAGRSSHFCPKCQPFTAPI